MNNNILVLSSGRTGSSFFCHILYRDIEYVREFFGGSVGHVCNVHLPILQQYYENRFAEGIFGYNKLLKTLSSYSLKEVDYMLNHTSTVISNTIDMNCFKNYKKFKNNTDFLMKVFPAHINGHTNTIDLKELVSLYDKYIILYRKNFLRQYISYEKSHAINVWNYKPDKSINEKYRKFKIKWDLKIFVEFVQAREESWWHFYEAIKDLPNPKAIIAYEDFAYKSNPREYVQQVLNKNNFNHIVNPNFAYGLRKQADESIPMANNFRNKEDFLKDYDSIKEIVECKIFDDVSL